MIFSGLHLGDSYHQKPSSPAELLVPSLYLLFALYVIYITLIAWVGDDAFITFRTIDNFINGYGLRWNVDERVQSFTHPLWLLILICGTIFTSNIFYLSLIISLLISTATFAIILFNKKIALPVRLVLGCVLLLSKCYVDYSTSGLENPLTHLLLTLFFLLAFAEERSSRSFVGLSLIVGLIATNRIDAVLIVLPLYVAIAYQRMRSDGKFRLMMLALIGAVPFLLWEAFSLFYFGFLAPNTAYAKLGAAQSRLHLITHGLLYLFDSFLRDSVTLLAIAVCTFLIIKKREITYVSAIAGPILYILYVINIGGDFMSGRFLAAPFLASLLIFVHAHQTITAHNLRQFVVCAFLAATLSHLLASPIINQLKKVFEEPENFDFFGINDERLFYGTANSLILVLFQDSPVSEHPWAKQGLSLRQTGESKIRITGPIGMLGYYAGATVKIIDYYALSDALLARLPASNSSEKIGHFMRELPAGYLEGVALKSNRLYDEDLWRYQQKLDLITKGSLWSFERLVEIISFNLGNSNQYLDKYLLRYQVSKLERDFNSEHLDSQDHGLCEQSYYWDETSIRAWKFCTGPGGSFNKEAKGNLDVVT